MRTVAALLALSSIAIGQPKPPPQSPTLTTPAHLGVRPGTQTLTLTGTRLATATAVVCPAPGVTFSIKAENPDANKRVVSVIVPADAPVGVYPIRMVTADGVTDARPLTIDPLPEVAETGTHDSLKSAQQIAVPAVVTGTATAEAADYFKFKVTAGQTLTIEAVGRRLGSPFDPVIVLHDAATGRELPGVYADDTPGLQSDARIVHTFKDAGEVVAELRDATYRGGAEYAYRLRVGEFPSAMTAFPLAVEAGKSAKVSATGPDAGRVSPAELSVKPPVTYFSPKMKTGQPGWAVPVRTSAHPEIVEVEPNDEPKTATKLPVPGGVSAGFGKKNDKDHFAVAGKKGQKLEVVARAAEMGAPTEVYLRVLDAKGAELAKSDPMKPTARLEFDPPADGDYVIAAEHLNYIHGPTEVYHLTVRPIGPDFDVTLGADRFAVAAGGVAVLPITGVTRANGFDKDIVLTITGVPGVTGTLTLGPKDAATPEKPRYLVLVARPGAKTGGYTATITATGGDITKPALTTELVKASFGGLPYPPPELLGRVTAAVIEKTPFTLESKVDGTKVTVTVKRAAGLVPAEFPVTVELLSAPPGQSAKPATAAKGSATLTLEGKATGAGPVLVTGKAKVGDVEYVVTGKP